ncbi:FAD-dependent monooxygenase [Nitratireductor sp. ZSWI3]|uniref:FAD-dependent monooxygenase n=1 Tax=Nitratireductor sp. ZSWI3 TaxID=2966359 RepID=UPI00214FA697|nr:FAD-dependent monooxygenase [Nitratireductor sp. ZSWI3]MCR4268181.1 FAD-dependent monooxygenase [Nitratireductor sp. ZSWI3]
MTREPALVIAGAGVAGLTLALALARHGLAARLYERAPELTEVGAGLQLSPNATRLLGRLGVLDTLAPAAIAPQAVVLRQAASLETLARVRLGAAAEARWGAPYLVAHRADLQAALLKRVREEASIELVTGALVEKADFVRGGGVRLSLRRGGASEDVHTPLLIGADGVWSHLRRLARTSVRSRFTGHVAWRTTLPAEDAAGLGEFMPHDQVTAFLDPRFHLIAYPVSGGSRLNIVAIVPGEVPLNAWEQDADDRPLRKALQSAHHAFARLSRATPSWTVWPIHQVDAKAAWTRPEGLALLGDAAHAVPPFAAQGAAMAIEDAVVLAACLARRPDNRPAALADYERIRKPRVVRVARRGAFNRLAWHAGGPVALVRDAVLKMRGETTLMADFDWLYGFDAEAGQHR